MASFFAVSGSSKEPGTRTTSTSLLAAPARSSASTAAARSRSVIKLLKRLTTIPKRNPAAVSPPSIFPGYNFSAIGGLGRSLFQIHLFLLCPLFPDKFRRPLLQKRLCPFTHVFGRTSQTKKGGFQEQSFLLRHFDAPLDRFHRVAHRNRRVGNDLLRQCLGRRQKLRRLVYMIHKPDTQRFVGANHFAGQAKFVSHSLAAKPRQPLRSAVSRQNAQFHFRLPELRRLARNSNGARQRHLTPAP